MTEGWLIGFIVMGYLITSFGDKPREAPKNDPLRVVYQTEAACKAAIPAAKKLLDSKVRYIEMKPGRFQCVRMEIAQ